MREPNLDAGNGLSRLFVFLTAGDLAGKRRRLIKQLHQPRFELIAYEIERRADINDRRWFAVEPRSDDIQHCIGFAGLSSGDENRTPVSAIAVRNRPHPRNTIGRDAGDVPRAGPVVITRQIAPVFERPLVRRRPRYRPR